MVILLSRVDFPTEGVFVCGLAHGPKLIDESLAQAKAAVSRAVTILAKDRIEAGGTVSIVDRRLCTGCGVCQEVCPFKAVEIDPKDKIAVINEALCKGCGICASTCRCGALTVKGFDDAEKALIESVERAGFECRIKPGGAVFYAPKVECDFHDALGRAWTLATVQIDMAMPERFGLRYIGTDGQEHRPAMLHRAVLGSLERFIAIYIEHTSGDFPLWLAPVQASVLPVADRHEEFARKVLDALQAGGVRAALDDRNETLGYRVRSAETQKIPYILVVGDREQADSTVSVRRRHRKGQQTVGVDEFRSKIEEEIRTRGIS